LVARYSEVWAEDAVGRALPVWLEVGGGWLRLYVDDRGARYPLVVDPLVGMEQAKLEASDGAAYDHFGYSVSLSGDGSRALIGADRDDTPRGVDAGSAYVFVRSGSGWSEEAKLEAGDGAASDQFGYSVSLSGDGSRALIGAYQDDTTRGMDAGSAYVFVWSDSGGWSQEAKLEASDGAANQWFGSSVSLSGDGSRALIGAPRDAIVRGTDVGSAYVFVRSGSSWSQEAKLVASDGAWGDWFGFSVSLSADGSRALIGADRDDTPRGWNVGSAYVFVRSGSSWSQEAKLEASDGAADDVFGISVSLSADGSRALIGASGDDITRDMNTGSAYVFVRSGSSWSQEAKLEASDGALGDWFGISVSLSADGSRALIGASWDDTMRGENAGSAYVFGLVGADDGGMPTDDAGSTDRDAGMSGGADGGMMAGADGGMMAGADGGMMAGADGGMMAGADASTGTDGGTTSRPDGGSGMAGSGGGCGCRTGRPASGNAAFAFAALALVVLARRRRSR
jgi:MYXO-CTERM domain-containing protein